MGKQNIGLRHRKPPLQAHEEPDDPNWPYAKGKLDPFGKITGFSVLIITFSLISYFRYQQYLKDIIITPLDSPRIIPSNSSSAAVNPDRFWGTYR